MIELICKICNELIDEPIELYLRKTNNYFHVTCWETKTHKCVSCGEAIDKNYTVLNWFKPEVLDGDEFPISLHHKCVINCYGLQLTPGAAEALKLGLTYEEEGDDMLEKDKHNNG